MLSLEEQLDIAQQIGTTRAQILSNFADISLGTSFLWIKVLGDHVGSNTMIQLEKLAVHGDSGAACWVLLNSGDLGTQACKHDMCTIGLNAGQFDLSE